MKCDGAATRDRAGVAPRAQAPVRLSDDRRSAGSRRFVRLSVAVVRDSRLRRPARGARSLGDRQRMGLCVVVGRLLHRMDLFRQRRARGGVRGLVPADLPRADARDAACLDRRAQDDPHRTDIPDHFDRRLRRQPLRQEPAAGGVGHVDNCRRHRSLYRAAAEGGFSRLSPAHQRSGAARGPDDRLVAGRHPLCRAGPRGVHDHVRHAPSGQRRAARRHGRGHCLRVGR